MATPPPSSPTRDHPFSLFAEALEHAASRQSTERAPTRIESPAKPTAPPARRTVTVPADPDVGIRSTPQGDVLQANYTHTLVVGRAKFLDREAAHASSPAFMGSQPAVNVCLPSTAKHVSRMHALIRWVPFTSPVSAAPQTMSGTFVLRIVGQNGLIVNGQRRRPGQVIRLKPGKTQLDFFGVSLRFVAPQAAATRPARAQAPARVSAVSPVKHRLPMPPSSPEPAPEPELSEPESPTRAAPRVRIAQANGPKDTPTPRDTERAAPPAPAQPAEPMPAVPETTPSESPQERQLPTPEPTAPRTSSSGADEMQASVNENPASSSPEAEASSDVPVVREPSQSEPEPRASPMPSKETPAKDESAAPKPASKESHGTEKRAKQEKRSETPRPEQAQAGLARLLVGRLAPTYDLAGLLAGAIVFHRTATISTSEAVRSVLSSNPGMLRGEAGARAGDMPTSEAAADQGLPLEHGKIVDGWEAGARWQTLARRAWHERLEQELQSAPMFGVIQRPGKDTNGKPLECWYHYDKENDPDVERAQNLGAFVKPMRNVVRSQKPIFWKKSEYSRATSGSSTNPQDDLLPYSPRNYYSSDTDDGERRKRSSTPSSKRVKLA